MPKISKPRYYNPIPLILLFTVIIILLIFISNRSKPDSSISHSIPDQVDIVSDYNNLQVNMDQVQEFRRQSLWDLYNANIETLSNPHPNYPNRLQVFFHTRLITSTGNSYNHALSGGRFSSIVSPPFTKISMTQNESEYSIIRSFIVAHIPNQPINRLDLVLDAACTDAINLKTDSIKVYQGDWFGLMPVDESEIWSSYDSDQPLAEITLTSECTTATPITIPLDQYQATDSYVRLVLVDGNEQSLLHSNQPGTRTNRSTSDSYLIL